MLANHQSWKLCYSPSTSKKTTQVSQNWLGELKTTILKLKKKQSSVLKKNPCLLQKQNKKSKTTSGNSFSFVQTHHATAWGILKKTQKQTIETK